MVLDSAVVSVRTSVLSVRGVWTVAVTVAAVTAVCAVLPTVVVGVRMAGQGRIAPTELAMIADSATSVLVCARVCRITRKCVIPGQETVCVSQDGQEGCVNALVLPTRTAKTARTFASVKTERSAIRSTGRVHVLQVTWAVTVASRVLRATMA